MTEKMSREWAQVTSMLNGPAIDLGPHLSDLFLHRPRELIEILARYKFAARMIGKPRRILDLDCGSGLGTWILAQSCGQALGIGDEEATVTDAAGRWQGKSISFATSAQFSSESGHFDAAVRLSWTRPNPGREDSFPLQSIVRRLEPKGVALLGGPARSFPWPPAGRSGARARAAKIDSLETELRRFFRHVFLFGCHGEIISTGDPASAPHFLALCAGKRIEPLPPEILEGP